MSNSQPLPISTHKASTWSIFYDIGMLFVIVLDLLIISVDAILMSSFGQGIATYFGYELTSYRTLSEPWYYHHGLQIIGGFFTIFLIAEVGIRWLIAIVQKRYYKWFFFPFIHWYEVLSCFPQLRALRLLRVVVIGYRLYKRGWNFLPKSWIATGKFYYEMILEEISDRVILTAIDSIEKELKQSNAHQKIVRNLINNHRHEIAEVVGELLQQEVAPALKQHAQLTKEGVGTAVYRALANVPELNKYLRLIPLAGKLIESEIQSIGQELAENITDEFLKAFYQEPHPNQQTNENFALISKAVGNISADHQALEKLVSSLVFSTLATVKEQIQEQQWRDKQQQLVDEQAD